MDNNFHNFQNNEQNPPLYAQAGGMAPSPAKGYSVAALVLGIIGILCCCSYVIGGTCAVLALVFALLSRKSLGRFNGLALAGLILAIIGLALLVSSIVSDILFADQLAEYQKFLEQWMAELEAGKVQGV